MPCIGGLEHAAELRWGISEPGRVPKPISASPASCELLPPGRRASGRCRRTPRHRQGLGFRGLGFRTHPSIRQRHVDASADSSSPLETGLLHCLNFEKCVPLPSGFPVSSFIPFRSQLLCSVSNGFLPCLKS